MLQNDTWAEQNFLGSFLICGLVCLGLTSVVETTQTVYADNIDSQKIEVAGFSYDVEKFSTAAIPKINLQKLYFEESNKDCKLIREYEAKNNINHIEECTIATVRFDLNNDQNDEIIAFVRNSFFAGYMEMVLF